MRVFAVFMPVYVCVAHITVYAEVAYWVCILRTSLCANSIYICVYIYRNALYVFLSYFLYICVYEYGGAIHSESSSIVSCIVAV